MTQPDAGWYPDPQDRTGERWWDGTAWTASTRAGAMPAMPAQPIYAEPHVAPVYGAVQPYTPAHPPAAIAPAYAQGPYAPMGPAPVGVWRSPVDNRPYVRGMGDAIRIVFAKYAQFDGRASRSEYWYFTLFSVLVTIGAYVLLLVPIVNILAVIALIGWALGVVVPSLAVTVRRLRDAGYHWAWLFISFVPFGGIVLIVFATQASKHP